MLSCEYYSVFISSLINLSVRAVYYWLTCFILSPPDHCLNAKFLLSQPIHYNQINFYWRNSDRFVTPIFFLMFSDNNNYGNHFSCVPIRCSFREQFIRRWIVFSGAYCVRVLYNRDKLRIGGLMMYQIIVKKLVNL